jgi:glycosyltransferase involved in cell wall biosynthesis
MAALSVLLVGTYVPRHDGLATFAADLARSLRLQEGVHVRVIAIDPEGETLRYGREVVGRIEQGKRDSYLRAGELAARLRPDVVSVQHEYGLWGIWGEALEKDFTVPFMQVLSERAPRTAAVPTLHTIRPSPPEFENDVLRRIVEASTASVVMARSGALLLMEDYGLPPDKLVHIPHGVPVFERRPRRHFKRQLGLEGRAIIATVGMLDPRKGIEFVISAMPEVVARHPEALYLIVGETHPAQRRHHGEQYRNELCELVEQLHLGDNVRFVNQYLRDRDLVDYLQASDIYVTPYLDRNQITSGTLAFAIGMGKAIVSTPYVHATEALAAGRGLLAEFRSGESVAHCLNLLLDDPDYRRDMEQRMSEYGAQDSWPHVGERYVDLFGRLRSGGDIADLLAVQPDPLIAEEAPLPTG